MHIGKALTYLLNGLYRAVLNAGKEIVHHGFGCNHTADVHPVALALLDSGLQGGAELIVTGPGGEILQTLDY